MLLRGSNFFKFFLLLKFSLLQFLLSDNDTLSSGKIKRFWSNELCGYLILLFLELFSIHEVRKIIFEHSNIRVNLSLCFKVCSKYDVYFFSKLLLSLCFVRFVFFLNFCKNLAEPDAELAEISLILAVKLKLFGLS